MHVTTLKVYENSPTRKPCKKYFTHFTLSPLKKTLDYENNNKICYHVTLSDQEPMGRTGESEKDDRILSKSGFLGPLYSQP